MAAPRPEISVTLSPALKQLRRAGREAALAGTSAQDIAPVQPTPDVPLPALAEVPPAPQEMIAVAELPESPAPALRERIRLRRDGARPLVFHGATLLEETDEADLNVAERPIKVRQHLALYLDADDSLVVAAQREIDGVETVRPVHLAQRVTDPAQLQRLFAGLDPLMLLLDPVGLAPSDAERGAMETFFGQAPQRLLSHVRGAVQH